MWDEVSGSEATGLSFSEMAGSPDLLNRRGRTRLFRPFGAVRFPETLPRACALGFILARSAAEFPALFLLLCAAAQLASQLYA